MAATVAVREDGRVAARLVFDGDCGFCTTSAHWLERHSTGVDVVPWQRTDLAAAGLTEQQVSTAVWWLEGDVRRRGARAVAQALRACGSGWSLVGRAIDLAPVRPFAALGYALVSRYRHRLPGGTPACRL
jgi:predicted DCC family thiol-disulfide oxidoreductase YuxK